MVGSSAVGAVGGWGDTVGCRADNGVAVVVDIAAVAGDVVVDTFRFGSLKDTSFLLSHSVSIPETLEILIKMNTISIICDRLCQLWVQFSHCRFDPANCHHAQADLL